MAGAPPPRALKLGALCPLCGEFLEDGQPCPNRCVLGGKTQTPRRRLLEAVWRSPRFKRLRRACFRRDDFTCQRCGRRDPSAEMLVADHRDGFDGPDDPRAFDLDELQTLCLTCSGEKDGGRRVYDR